jgi:chromosome segregation ATPase
MASPEEIGRIEKKLDKLGEAVDSLVHNYQQLVTNQSLMQQEIQGLARALNKLEDIDKQFMICKGDCNGRANLLQKDIEENEKDIVDLKKKIRFRDKVILGLFVTVFMRMFLFFLLGVK